MKIFYRNKLKKDYENISKIFNGKTTFLQKLPKIKNDGLKIIKDQQTGIIIENILKINDFKRDYSYFSSNSRFKVKKLPLKIHFSNGVNYPIEERIKKSYSYCKTKRPEFGKLPILNNIKFQFESPKNRIPIKFAYNIFNRNKLSFNGKNNIENSDIFSNNE